MILCTGAYQRPHRPRFGGRLPVGDGRRWMQRGTTTPRRYRPDASWSWAAARPAARSPKELCESGRELFLACGRSPLGHRGGPKGRDIVTWLNETTGFRTPVSALPSPRPACSGRSRRPARPGGTTCTTRTLQAMGVELLGRLTGVEGHMAGSPATCSTRSHGVTPDTPPLAGCSWLSSATARRRGPNLHRSAPDPPRELDLRGFGAVIFTSGFRPDYDRWVRLARLRSDGLSCRPDGASTSSRTVLLRCPLPADKGILSLFGAGEPAAAQMAGRLPDCPAKAAAHPSTHSWPTSCSGDLMPQPRVAGGQPTQFQAKPSATRAASQRNQPRAKPALDPNDARHRERGRLDVERVRGSRIGRDRSYLAYAFTRKEPLDSISIAPRCPFDDRHVPPVRAVMWRVAP